MINSNLPFSKTIGAGIALIMAGVTCCIVAPEIVEKTFNATLVKKLHQP